MRSRFTRIERATLGATGTPLAAADATSRTASSPAQIPAAVRSSLFACGRSRSAEEALGRGERISTSPSTSIESPPVVRDLATALDDHVDDGRELVLVELAELAQRDTGDDGELDHGLRA